MLDTHLVEMEKLFLALSDKTRIQILALIADGEVSVGYLADTLQQSQPKISRHLAYLRNTGIVSTRRDGKWIYYEISDDIPEQLTYILYEILAVFRSSKQSKPASRPLGPRLQNDLDEPDIEFHSEADENVAGAWEPEELDIFLL